MNPGRYASGRIAVEYLLPQEWRQEQRFGERTSAGCAGAAGDASRDAGDHQLGEATGAGAGPKPVRGGGGVPVPALDGGHAGLAVAAAGDRRLLGPPRARAPAGNLSRPLERISCGRRGLAPTVLKHPRVLVLGCRAAPELSHPGQNRKDPHPSQPRERQTIQVVDKGVPHGG